MIINESSGGQKAISSLSLAKMWVTRQVAAFAANTSKAHAVSCWKSQNAAIWIVFFALPTRIAWGEDVPLARVIEEIKSLAAPVDVCTKGHFNQCPKNVGISAICGTGW